MLTLQIVRHYTRHHVSDEALLTLRRIMQVAMLIIGGLITTYIALEHFSSNGSAEPSYITSVKP